MVGTLHLPGSRGLPLCTGLPAAPQGALPEAGTRADSTLTLCPLERPSPPPACLRWACHLQAFSWLWWEQELCDLLKTTLVVKTPIVSP